MTKGKKIFFLLILIFVHNQQHKSKQASFVNYRTIETVNRTIENCYMFSKWIYYLCCVSGFDKLSKNQFLMILELSVRITQKLVEIIPDMYTFLKRSWLNEYFYAKFNFQIFSGKKLENFEAIFNSVSIFFHKNIY